MINAADASRDEPQQFHAHLLQNFGILHVVVDERLDLLEPFVIKAR